MESANRKRRTLACLQLTRKSRLGPSGIPTDLTKLQKIMAMYFGLISLVDDSIGRIVAELQAQNLLGGGIARDELVQQVDIFPSACEFAGLPIPDSVRIVGMIVEL